MADEKISLEIAIESSKSAQTLGELEDSLEELNKQIRDVPRGSKDFDKLSTAIASAGREVKNMELNMEALDNEQVASEIGSVAGAFGDVTASLVLLSGENETIEQMAANIEMAMGISMGLKGAIEGISSAQKLWTNLLKTHAAVQKAVTVATKLFKVALISTGIGAIVIGLIALATNLESVGKFFKWVGDQIMKYFKPMIDLAIDTLQFFGIVASDEELAAQARAKAQEERIKKQSQQARDTASIQIAELERTAKAEREINDARLTAFDREIALRQANGEDTKAIELERIQFLADVAQQEFEIEKRKVEVLQDSIKKQLELRGISLKQAQELAGAQRSSLEQMFGKGAIDALFGTSEAMDEAQARVEEAAFNLELFKTKANKTARDKNNEAKQKQLEDDEFWYNAELASYEKFLEEERRLKNERLAAEAVDDKIELDAYDEFLAQEKVLRDERIAEEKAAQEAKNQAINDGFAQAAQTVNLLSDLNSAALELDLAKAGDNEEKKEKLRRASFEREKKLNIARALISGAQAVMQALAGSPPPASYILAAGTAVLTGVQVAAISKAKYNGGGGSSGVSGLSSAASGASGASGGANINPVSNTSTLIGDQKVFVTEADISSTQKKVNVIEESATF